MNNKDKFTQKSLERILDFYSNRGFNLNYFPKLKLVDEDFKELPYTIALVKNEIETFDKFSDLSAKLFGVSIWKEAYHLNVSEDSINELNTAIKKNVNLNSLITLDNYGGGDIFIFPLYYKISETHQEATLAHEVWHLIEKEKGVLSDSLLIREGTAEYAEKLFMNERFVRELEEIEEFREILYQGAGKIVQDKVSHLQNPYEAMLDPKLRSKIEEEFIERLKPVLVKKVKKTFEDKNYLGKFAAMSIKIFPGLSDLKSNLRKESILDFYKKLGANKLAEEIKDQDLSHLIDYYRLIGF